MGDMWTGTLRYGSNSDASIIRSFHLPDPYSSVACLKGVGQTSKGLLYSIMTFFLSTTAVTYL